MRLGLFLAFMFSAQPPVQAEQPDPRSWYGFRIGDPAPSGSLEGENQGGYRWGLAVPAPWSNAAITKDEQGRITSISLREECCGQIVLDAPPHSRVPPPPVYVPPKQMMTDGEALIGEALRRFGPATEGFDIGKSVDRHIIMHWKFLVEFRGCEGARAIFDSPAHEASGTLGDVFVQVDRDEIMFTVASKSDASLRNVKEPTQQEMADQQESCRRDDALSRWFNSPTRAEDNQRDCATEPETCTVIDGAVFYHPRGQRAKQIPCPPGHPPICRCFTFVGKDDTPTKPSLTAVGCGGISPGTPPATAVPN